MLEILKEILFPRKCVLCRKLLKEQETDLCPACRVNAPIFTKSKKSFPFVAGWTAVWYYKDNVRGSILRYKFGYARSYASSYGRILAMRIQEKELDSADVLTWVPVSAKRRRRRGFDQCELIAARMGEELGIRTVQCLKKTRNNPPQSRLRDPWQRKANVLGAYTIIDREIVAGKRVLLVDDIITTGATVSECARVLLTAGAKEVTCAALAAAERN